MLRKRERKECQSGKMGGNAEKCCFLSKYGYGTDEVAATVVTCTRSSQSQRQHGQETASQGHTYLSSKSLATDGCWGKVFFL